MYDGKKVIGCADQMERILFVVEMFEPYIKISRGNIADSGTYLREIYPIYHLFSSCYDS